MDTVTISRDEYESLVQDSQKLKNSHLYKRLLDFEKNVSENGEFTREDLGF
jgi:hypothetical protein